MPFFTDDEGPDKIRFIEEQCKAASVIIDAAESDGVLMDIFTTWNKPRTTSYEMTVLARNNLLKDEDEI